MEKFINLKGRLLQIANCVQNSSILADIGCDHGKLCIYLLEQGKTNYVYASDISPDSVNKARILRDKCGFENKMEIVIADGLSGIEKQPDTIVIAGMGGELIADILEKGSDMSHKAENIIMQPMRGIFELHKYLHEGGYLITHESVCKEAGHLYEIICAKYMGSVQKRILPNGFYEFDEAMLRDDNVREYIAWLKFKLQRNINNANSGGTQLTEQIKMLNDLIYIEENLL